MDSAVDSAVGEAEARYAADSSDANWGAVQQARSRRDRQVLDAQIAAANAEKARQEEEQQRRAALEAELEAATTAASPEHLMKTIRPTLQAIVSSERKLRRLVGALADAVANQNRSAVACGEISQKLGFRRSPDSYTLEFVRYLVNVAIANDRRTESLAAEDPDLQGWTDGAGRPHDVSAEQSYKRAVSMLSADGA